MSKPAQKVTRCQLALDRPVGGGRVLDVSSPMAYRAGTKGHSYAHRQAYEENVGPIPKGWHVHHECHIPSCVNPDHLRAVPPDVHDRIHPREWTTASIQGRHNAQKTHCRNGHEYTPENTYNHMKKTGPVRVCRTCHLERSRQKYAVDPEPFKERVREYARKNRDEINRKQNERYERKKLALAS